MKEKLLHPIRKLKSWVEGFAGRPHAVFALFACGFVEASVIPLPVDVLLIALGVAKPRTAIFYSVLAAGGSLAGSLLGYLIGSVLYDAVGSRIIEFFGAGDQFGSLLYQYRSNAWLVLLLAGFTPIPFMVFAMAAGFNSTVDPATLFLGALCGRVLRFVPIGILLFIFGPTVKEQFDHYLGRTLLVLGLVLLLSLIVSRNLF